MISLEESDSCLPRRGKALLKDIDSFSKQRRKENRVLARNIAEWVDEAMSGGGREGEDGNLSTAVESADTVAKEGEDHIHFL